MGRSPYQSEKRRKEIARLKKQEEKRQRRFNKKTDPEGGNLSAIPTVKFGLDGLPIEPSDPDAKGETPDSKQEPKDGDKGPE